jgi:hypothetical protein
MRNIDSEAQRVTHERVAPAGPWILILRFIEPSRRFSALKVTGVMTALAALSPSTARVSPFRTRCVVWPFDQSSKVSEGHS